MASVSKQIGKSSKALHRLQRKQAKSIRRIGSLFGRLEKRSGKILTIEDKMAGLEQRLSALRNPVDQPVAKSARGLRPARLIINPKSGTFTQKVESPEKLVAMLHAHGIQAKVYLKTSRKAVRRWACKAVDKNEELVIAVGGDGTVEDVGLALVGSRTLLGIIPTGVMNNHARRLGIPLDIEQACALLGAGITRQIDVGCISEKEENSTQEELDCVVIPRAIQVIVGQGSGLDWQVNLVHCVPKMLDVQAATNNELAASQSIPTTGSEHWAFEVPPEKEETLAK